MSEGPLARSTDPWTSHAGERDISDRLGAEQIRAERFVLEHPGRTGNELAQIAGDTDTRRLPKRLPELERKGRVVRGVVRRCSISGRSGTTWWPPGRRPPPPIADVALEGFA